MNPTLIAGFEDIMTHIKNQGEQIKNLEQNEKVREARVQELYQENQQLKENIDDAVENHFSDLKLRETTHKEWNTLEEENKNLQAQIKNLEALIKEHEERRDLSDQLNYELNVLLDEKTHDLEQACEVAGWSPTSSKEPVKKD